MGKGLGLTDIHAAAINGDNAISLETHVLSPATPPTECSTGERGPAVAIGNGNKERVTMGSGGISTVMSDGLAGRSPSTVHAGEAEVQSFGKHGQDI